MEIALSILAFISLIVYIVSTMMIYDYLKKRGEKVTFLWIRFFMISYANMYRELTIKESGRPGTLFYVWIISINMALICTIIVIFVL